MNKDDLKRELTKMNIPEHWYFMGGYGNDDQKFCLEECNGKWLVYYSERGEKFKLKEFQTEDEATNELYERLIKKFKRTMI